jgi:hypothetical protein
VTQDTPMHVGILLSLTCYYLSHKKGKA